MLKREASVPENAKEMLFTFPLVRSTANAVADDVDPIAVVENVALDGLMVYDPARISGAYSITPAIIR